MSLWVALRTGLESRSAAEGGAATLEGVRIAGAFALGAAAGTAFAPAVLPRPNAAPSAAAVAAEAEAEKPLPAAVESVGLAVVPAPPDADAM